MSSKRPSRPERIRLVCAAVGGVLSGVARALTDWLTGQQG
jgi:hypothetical protein